MANPEHLARLKEGVEAWNAWREENPNIRPDLYKANLREANLAKANLQKANLIEADLRGTVLAGANLNGANLGDADVTGADLTGANLTKANLFRVKIYEAILTGVDLSEAKFGEQYFETFDGKRQEDIIGLKTKGGWLVMDLYRFLHDITIIYNRIYVHNQYIHEGYEKLRAALENSQRYIPREAELEIESIVIKSPSEFNLKGSGEIVGQIRQLIKDLKYRNRMEEELESISLMRQKAALLKDLGYTQEEIRDILGVHLLPVRRIEKQIDKYEVELLE